MACTRALWGHFARVFMSARECLLASSDRGLPEANEQVVADLHDSLAHLAHRRDEMEAKIERAAEQAAYHKRLSDKERALTGKKRELDRARMFLLDRRRLQKEMDRVMSTMHILRQQIDSLVSSHVDNIVVDAMRSYSMTAKRLGLPDKSKEIEGLATELEERGREVEGLQDAMAQISATLSDDSNANGMDDSELMLELEALIESDAEDPIVLPSVPSVVVVQKEEVDVDVDALISSLESETQQLRQRAVVVAA